MTNIAALAEREVKRVLQFNDARIACKLMAMGMLPGSIIKVMRKAPMNGGFYLKVNGHGMALRVNEAASVIVE